jgi:hypothetical protein
MLALSSGMIYAEESITESLTASQGEPGELITISGVTTPRQFVSIKIVNQEGSIVFFSAVASDESGGYTCQWLVPDIEPGPLEIIVGYDTITTVETFTVLEVKNNNNNNGNNNPPPIVTPTNPEVSDDEEEEEDDPKGEDKEIRNGAGEVIEAKVEETERGHRVSIERDVFNGLENQEEKSLHIQVNDKSIVFDSKVVEHLLASGEDGDVKLTIEQMNYDELSEKMQKKIGTRPVFDFELQIGDSKVSKLGGHARISVPYELGEYENPRAVIVYYMDESDRLVKVRGKYNQETKSVEFRVNHFSLYAVGYNEVVFQDVGLNDWFYNGVTFCGAREITDGTEEGIFSPELSLTRAQCIVMLMRAYQMDLVQDSTDNFVDAGNTYYTDYLATAKALGISDGVGNNRYDPEAEITRQECFTLLYRLLGVIEEMPTEVRTLDLGDFQDGNLAADYALEGMNYLIKAGIISGHQEKIEPTQVITRAEMVEVIMNLLD